MGCQEWGVTECPVVLLSIQTYAVQTILQFLGNIEHIWTLSVMLKNNKGNIFWYPLKSKTEMAV